MMVASTIVPSHQQTALLQHRPDLIEQYFGQFVLLQPMAEVQHRRRLRNRRYRQVDPSKAAQGLAIVERVFQCLVGQPVPLLQKVEPQHPFQPDRRPAALAFWVKRPQPLHQPRPGNHLLHLGQKFVPPRLLFLAGVLRLRKTPLPLHRPVPRSPRTPGFYPMPAPAARIFRCFLSGFHCRAYDPRRAKARYQRGPIFFAAIINAQRCSAARGIPSTGQ
jgi:hypothetical protein